MLAGTANIDTLMRKYESLVKKTSHMLAIGTHPDMRGRQALEVEQEDVEQILRLKVWKALQAFDPAKSRMTQERYVFMCVRDQVKDIVKKRRLNHAYIEDLAPQEPSPNGHVSPRDKFDGRYLSESHDEVYNRVEDELPPLPDTLTERELPVVALMFRDFKQTEIAERLGWTKREVEAAVRQIRIKLADWKADCESQ